MASKPAIRVANRDPSLSQPWLHQHGMEIQQFGTVRIGQDDLRLQGA
jgi:hypothetical protein